MVLSLANLTLMVMTRQVKFLSVLIYALIMTVLVFDFAFLVSIISLNSFSEPSQSEICLEVLGEYGRKLGWCLSFAILGFSCLGLIYMLILNKATRTISDMEDDRFVAGEQGELYRHYGPYIIMLRKVVGFLIISALVILIFQENFLALVDSEN